MSLEVKIIQENIYPTVEKYNIDSGQWETISAQLKDPRAYLGAGSYKR